MKQIPISSSTDSTICILEVDDQYMYIKRAEGGVGIFIGAVTGTSAKKLADEIYKALDTVSTKSAGTYTDYLVTTVNGTQQDILRTYSFNNEEEVIKNVDNSTDQETYVYRKIARLGKKPNPERTIERYA